MRNWDIFSLEKRIFNLEKNGGSTPSQSWDYSTTETDTHQKWIDGKTIYCKVITGAFNFTANTQLIILPNKGDIETIIDSRIFANTAIASPQIYFSDNSVAGVHFANFGATKVILYYTKTEPTKSTKRSKKA